MKHVNLDPELEQKKSEVMQQFEPGHAEANDSAADACKATIDTDKSDETLELLVIESLKNVYDPEIPVNIYDLGLIYRVDIKDGYADVDMTLTAPGCPVAHTFPGLIEATVRSVDGIKDAHVELVWDPPWTQDRISEAARLQLGLI